MKLLRKAAAFITAILDIRSTFASDVSIAAAAGEAIIGDVMPMDTTGMNLGNAMTPVYLVVGITEAVVSAGAATVQFKLYSHSTATVTSGVEHFASAAIPKADLTVGEIAVAIILPQGDYGAYLGVSAVTAVATTTAGKINAHLTMDAPNGWKAYPDAITD
jgi:hypothetical protein